MLRLLILFAVAASAGQLFVELGAPLPWMIGPLLVTAAIFASGVVAVDVPVHVRPFGQIVVACQVGLTFSPAALAMLLELAPVVVGTALLTGVCVLGVAALLSRCSGLGVAQSFLATVPTSPVEAGTIALRAGIDPMLVILTQTIRMSAVVVLVPLALSVSEGWPERQAAAFDPAAFDPLAMLLLTGIGIAGVAVFRFVGLSNPNFLGPLAFTAALAATGNPPKPIPPEVLALAQVVLGMWLGSCFRREILNSARSLALACTLSILLLLALTSAGGVLIALLAGLDWRLLVLGAAPGGVVEMALTAKSLGQDVALITAFHLTRIFILMPSVPWVIAVINRFDSSART